MGTMSGVKISELRVQNYDSYLDYMEQDNEGPVCFLCLASCVDCMECWKDR